MRIIIDGDACPNVNDIFTLGQAYNIEVILVIDTSHNVKNEHIKTIIVDTNKQSVDIKIANVVKENDIVITNDYGLAVMCIGKKAKVINPKGMIYNKKNIDTFLEIRYINYINRKQGMHIKGPKKRTKEDVSNLLKTLKKIIKISI